jgi:hypothetical protein
MKGYRDGLTTRSPPTTAPAGKPGTSVDAAIRPATARPEQRSAIQASCVHAKRATFESWPPGDQLEGQHRSSRLHPHFTTPLDAASAQ